MMKRLNPFLLRQLRDIAIVMVIGMGISTIFAGFGMWESTQSLKRVAIYSFVIGFSLWKSNEYITSLISYLLPKNTKPSTKLFIDLVATLFVSAIVIYTVNYLLFPSIYGIRISDNLNLFLIIGIIQLFISLLISGVFYVKQFFTEWLKSSVNEEKLKREALILQYEALKSNVNPHFLFNSLSVLSSLIDTDSNKAKQFIQQFSDIYRYVLEHRDKEVVPVIDEVSFIKSFINLHLIRHESGLNIKIEIDNMAGYIVPLSLQILIENCLKHNIISEEKQLNVTVIRENDYITVQNNLQKRNAIQESNGVGLDTIRKRYEYLSDKKVIIEQNANSYSVKIPILHEIYN